MNILTSIKDAIALVQNSIKSNEDWTRERDSVLAKLQEAETTLADFAKTQDDMNTLKTSLAEREDSHKATVAKLTADSASLKSEYEAKIQDLTKKLEEAEKVTAVKINNVVLNETGIDIDKLPKVAPQTNSIGNGEWEKIKGGKKRVII